MAEEGGEEAARKSVKKAGKRRRETSGPIGGDPESLEPQTKGGDFMARRGHQEEEEVGPFATPKGWRPPVWQLKSRFQAAAGGCYAPRRAILPDRYTTLVTLPALRQRVHTRRRLTVPPTMARKEARLGSHRRFVTLWAWLILWPTDGPFPQISHR